MSFSKLSVERAIAAESVLGEACDAAWEAGDVTRAKGIESFYMAIARFRIYGAKGKIRVGGTPDGRDIIEPVDSLDLDMIVGNALAYLGQ